MTQKRFHHLAVLLASASIAAMPNPAFAQQAATYPFDLQQQDLGEALRSVAAKAGWELYVSAEDVDGLPAPRIKGSLTARQAIARLLAGTDVNGGAKVGHSAA